MANRNGETPSYSVTSAGVNPAEDRAHRMRMYFIAMSLRVVCVASLFWVRGWWMAIALIGAALLPWFAVMVGNAVAHGGEEQVDALEPQQIEASAPEALTPETELLVVDVDPVRRSEPGADEGQTAEAAPQGDAAGPGAQDGRDE